MCDYSNDCDFLSLLTIQYGLPYYKDVSLWESIHQAISVLPRQERAGVFIEIHVINSYQGDVTSPCSYISIHVREIQPKISVLWLGPRSPHQK